MRSACAAFPRRHCIIDREIRGIQHRVQDRFEGITDGEYESLIDIALGLTDRAIAARRGLSIRGARAASSMSTTSSASCRGGRRKRRFRVQFADAGDLFAMARA